MTHGYRKCYPAIGAAGAGRGEQNYRATCTVQVNSCALQVEKIESERVAHEKEQKAKMRVLMSKIKELKPRANA